MGSFGMIRSRNQRDACSASELASFELVAHLGDVVDARTNECNLVIGASLSQGGPFGKKSIARMKCVAARPLSRRDDVLDLQVTVRRARWTDANRAVSQLGGHALAIRVGDSCDGFHAQTPAGADYAHCN